MADTSWRRSPADGEALRRLLHLDGDALLLGGGAHALDRLGDDQVHGDGLAPGLLLGLDAGQLEQVVDGAADPERLGEHALGEAVGDGGVVLGEERLGQQRRARRPAS